MVHWSVRDAAAAAPLGMSRPSSIGYYGMTYAAQPDGPFFSMVGLSQNTPTVVDWSAGQRNSLVRMAIRGTKQTVASYLHEHEKIFASSLAGRLALSIPDSAKLRSVFNFSQPGFFIPGTELEAVLRIHTGIAPPALP